MTKQLFIKEIWRYPIYGCAGQKLESVFLDEYGIVFDRRWIVVDENGVPVSHIPAPHEMHIPKLCRVTVEELDRSMLVRAPNMPDLLFFKSASPTELYDVQIGEHTMRAKEVSEIASGWFTKLLSKETPKRKYRLVQLVDHRMRVEKEDVQLSFEDYPSVLILSDASLQGLNGQPEMQGRPVGAERFRAHIVIGGGDPFCEDFFDLLKARTVIFQRRGFSDQEHSIVDERSLIDERPIKALSRYRRWKFQGHEGVWFGQHYIVKGAGRIKVGMPLKVLGW